MAIVGAGVLGLAHAYVAARRGRSVVVFERNDRARGASIRNFGMIWPIGQPAGRMHRMAMRSRELWQEVLSATRLPYQPSGSLHVVYREDEAAVAQEFAGMAPALGYECQWLSAAQVLDRSHAVVASGLIGGLWSPTELVLDPRLTMGALPEFLSERFGVTFRFGAAVRSIALPVVETGAETWRVQHAIVCSGDDFETLYPCFFRDSPVTRCKLQMMRTAPQGNGWELGPSLAAGLTLRFYPAFRICATLGALQSRIAAEMPEYEKWGIHVLVSQTARGELTLGDSHEYGRAIDIFDKSEIDTLVLKYLRTFLRAPSLDVAEHWHGVYARHPEQPFISWQAEPGARVVTAPGGSGMTLSFGLAEHTMQQMEI